MQYTAAKTKCTAAKNDDTMMKPIMGITVVLKILGGKLMKKVLVAILAVALVLSALVVPAFALEASEPVLSDGILTENELLSLTDMGSNTSVGKTFSNFPGIAFIKFEPTSGNGWINLGTVDLSKYVSMTYEATGSTIDWHSRTDIDNGEHYMRASRSH